MYNIHAHTHTHDTTHINVYTHIYTRNIRTTLTICTRIIINLHVNFRIYPLRIYISSTQESTQRMHVNA